MIPKVIDYCWFGNGKIPEKDQKCIDSWKKFCPDYEIVQWNENNYDINKNAYMKEAYEAKKWGFVPDFARLDIIYNNGGIYLDTDVELVKSLDEVLDNQAYFGFEEGEFVNPGSGFGAEPYHPGIKKLMEIYQNKHFKKEDGTFDTTPSPVLHRDRLKDLGAIMNDKKQEVEGITIYPTEYFCPFRYYTGLLKTTDKTISIHRYNMSWIDENSKKWTKREQKLSRIIHHKYARKIIKVISFPDRKLYQWKMKRNR